MMRIICRLWCPIEKLFAFLAPAGDLFIRLWIARIFFLAGLTKIDSWNTTVALFTYEYSVPLLPPTVAAYLGTGIELVFPVLILLGLLGRLPALVLFVYNIIAVYSYPFLLTKEGAVGLDDHFLLGSFIVSFITPWHWKIILRHLIQALVL